MYYSMKPVMQARRSENSTLSHTDVMASLQCDGDAAAGGSASTGETKIARKTCISDGCDSVTAVGM